MSNAGTLTPFTPETARIAAARSADARRAKRAARTHSAHAVAEHLRTLRDAHERDTLGATCAAAAADLIGRVTRGEIPVRHAADAADLVRVLVDIARLESGLPTSTSVIAHMSSADARARLAELRALAGDVLAVPAPSQSATALAAADTPLPAADGTSSVPGAGTDLGTR